MTVSGAGTGVTGGRVPFGGWVLSLEKFTRLEVHPGYAVAGAGVLLRDVHAAALRVGTVLSARSHRDRGFDRRHHRLQCQRVAQFPLRRDARAGWSACAWCSPMAACSTSGAASRSISTRARFRCRQSPRIPPAICCAPAWTGSISSSARKARWAWSREATLRLLPAPKAVLAGLVFFPSDDQRGRAPWSAGAPRHRRACWSISTGPRSTCCARAFRRFRRQRARPILFDQELESEDDPEIDVWLERLEGTGALAEDSWFATTATDRERFRRFRHALPELVNDAVRRSGAMKMNTDFAVPLARNREMLAYYRQRLEEEFPGRYVIFGHIGDAHVHVNLFSDPADPRHAAALLAEFARQAVEMGGTVSAEHGVGKRKAHLLALQYAPEHLEAMRAVKRRLDPANILGRGTMVARRLTQIDLGGRRRATFRYTSTVGAVAKW